MPRPRLLTRALAVVTLAVGPVVAPVAAAEAAPAVRAPAAEESGVTPLSVRITSMTPGVVPTRGAIVLRGLVANGSRQPWSDVSVAPFLSSEPITSAAALAEADATDPSQTVGSRLRDASTYVAVGDLEPGQRVPFRIRVPRASLEITGDPGVYWIGVHALGTSVEGRDLVADGRARTFIPLVTRALARRRSSEVALVLPFRERARRAADGSLNGPTRWASMTGPEGRLRRLADFAASAGSASVTWELDPAVLDALEDYAHGNPPLSLGSARRVEDTSGPSPSPSASASPDGSPGESPGASPSAEGSGASPQSVTPGGSRSGSPTAEQRAGAAATLETFVDAVRDDTLLRMPYADADATALARRASSLLSVAQELSTRRLRARDLEATPAIAPPDGHVDPRLLGRVARDTLLVLGDPDQEAAQDPGQAPYARLPTGQPLALTDPQASSGGPAPTTPYDPLAVRQRVLAEAALRVTTGDPRPLVVGFPMRWDPGPTWREADFFGGLQQVPWLRLAPLATGGGATYRGDLPYGRDQRAEEIGRTDLEATRTLVRTGVVLADLLANANDVRDRLTGAALQASAYSARARRELAADQVRALDATVRGRLDEVQVTGTDFVTLSGSSGSLTVTLVNGLAQPITVGVRARTDSGAVHVESHDPVELGPGQRFTMRLAVRSATGLHEVSLYPVTVDGAQAGAPFAFDLRTSQVGEVIWYVMAGGGALLFVMIVRRIVLRLRNRSWRVEEGS